MNINVVAHDTLLPDDALVVERNAYLVERAKDKNILHLGAVDVGYYEGRLTTEEWLHAQLMQVSLGVVGIDWDRDGITTLREKHTIENITYGDLEHLDAVDLSGSFDLVVAGEILEHLSNCGLFLEGVKRFFGTHTTMIITVPNAYFLWRFLLTLRNREIVNTDHVNHFSYVTLRSLLLRHGFKVERFLLYDRVDGRGSGARNRIKDLLSRLIVKFAPFASAGLICEVSLPCSQ